MERRPIRGHNGDSRPRGGPRPPVRPYRRKLIIPSEYRDEVQQLHDQWDLAPHVALRIAKGELNLQDAIQFQARKNSIAKLSESYDFTGSIAAQVIDNQMSLEYAQFVTRWHKYKKRHFQRSIFIERQQTRKPLVLSMFQEDDRVVLIEENLKFEFSARSLHTEEPELIHKLRVKYAYDPENLKQVQRLVRIDETLRKQGQTAAYKIMDRYRIKDRLLFYVKEQKTVLMITSLEGDIFRGIIDWFSKFEIGLAMKGGCPVVLLRHAIDNIETKDGKALENLKLATY